MKGLKIQFHTRKKKLLQLVGFAAGGYLFGLMILAFVKNALEAEIIPFMGTILAIATVLFIHFFGIMISFVGEFNMAISMGATRKSYVGSYLLFTIGEMAILELLTGVLATLEGSMLGRFYPGAWDGSVVWYWQPKVLISTAISLPVMELFLAALILKFGMKAFWGIWVLMMLFMAILSNLSHSEKFTNSMHQLGLLADKHLTVCGGLIIEVIGILVLATVSWALLRRQQVTA